MTEYFTKEINRSVNSWQNPERILPSCETTDDCTMISFLYIYKFTHDKSDSKTLSKMQKSLLFF